MTQTDRLIRWLRANPGASSIEITVALRLPNVTGRVSDARAEGHVIDAVRGSDRTWRYYLREPAQMALPL
jgi:hypothetical protein